LHSETRHVSPCSPRGVFIPGSRIKSPTPFSPGLQRQLVGMAQLASSTMEPDCRDGWAVVKAAGSERGSALVVCGCRSQGSSPASSCITSDRAPDGQVRYRHERLGPPFMPRNRRAQCPEHATPQRPQCRPCIDQLWLRWVSRISRARRGRVAASQCQAPLTIAATFARLEP